MNEQVIEKAKRSDTKVCAFGAGKIGIGIGLDLAEFLGINIDFYCDNDEAKWNKIVIDGKKCVSPSELFQISDDLVCMILVSEEKIPEIYNQLISLGITDIIPFTYVHFTRYDIRNKMKEYFPFDIYKHKSDCAGKEAIALKVQKAKTKIAVYTCVTGGYDEIHKPKYLSPNCDYYFISEQKPKELAIWKYLDIGKYLPDMPLDERRMGRYCKLHPHKIFPQYDYSIYLDGNVLILDNIGHFIQYIGKSGIAALQHPWVKNIYEEGAANIYYEKDTKELIIEQVTGYWKEGMPYNLRHHETSIMVRQHMNKTCIQIMEAWWHEISSKSFRDQLSFEYVLWKNNIRFEDVGVFLEGKDWRTHKAFQHYVHTGK